MGIFACKNWRHAVCDHSRGICTCPKGSCAQGGKCVREIPSKTVKGYLCEKNWRAKWADGVTTRGKGYCCTHRSASNGKMNKGSWCRINKWGKHKLKRCAPRALSLAEEGELADGEEAEDEDVEGDDPVADDADALRLGCGGFIGGASLVASALFIQNRRSKN